MNRKNIITFCIVILLTILVYLGIKAFGDIKATNKFVDLPTINFIDETHSNFTFTQEEIHSHRKQLLIYIDLTCDLCTIMINRIYKADTLFKDYKIYAISSTPIDSLVAYKLKHNIFNKKIVFLSDSSATWINDMRFSVSPTFIIYNNGRFIKKIEGETLLTNLYIK